MPIFSVKSVKIYTGQKNLHWRRQWRQWQLSGMPRNTSGIIISSLCSTKAGIPSTAAGDGELWWTTWSSDIDSNHWWLLFAVVNSSDIWRAGWEGNCVSTMSCFSPPPRARAPAIWCFERYRRCAALSAPRTRSALGTQDKLAQLGLGLIWPRRETFFSDLIWSAIVGTCGS